MSRAREFYKKAIDYAPPYVGLADAIATPAHQGFASPNDAYPEARQLHLKALELDEHLAEAHDLMARINWAYYWSPVTTEKGFLRAI